MSNYVLVHGEWSGEWVWERTAAAIRKARHALFHPTLTGMGSLLEDGSPETGLDTHIQDVVSLLEEHDLQRVILTGHGYGGMVITGVAERVPERLSHLIFLDAFSPRDGQSLAEMLGPAPMAALEEQARRAGEGWRVPPPDPEWLGIDPFHAAEVSSKLTAQPLKTFHDRIQVSNGSAQELPRTFVHCKDPSFPGIEPLAAKARAAGWRFQALQTGHFPQIEAPNQVADLLLELERRGLSLQS
jgi:pimeloyl-ACP methyl ester carboxylesterase